MPDRERGKCHTVADARPALGRAECYTPSCSMCGIFGYTGLREASSILLDGLMHLSYRGYDSAGVAVVDDFGHLSIRRAAGKLDNLRRLVENEPVTGRQGIGHTRWATHGPASNVNAHPHTDGTGEVVVVHNGIVENYVELRSRLTANGHTFLSQTDTEIIPHMIEELLGDGLPFEEAVRLAAGQLRGAHAIACMHARTPETLVVARIGNAGGIAVGAGDSEMLVASDLPALANDAATAVFLEPGESAVVRPEGFELRRLDGRLSTRALRPVGVSGGAAAKGGYKHFTLKEIHEQPDSAMGALQGRIGFSQGEARLDEVMLPFTDAEAAGLTRVVFLGMGTSIHAGMVGARYMETLARIPAFVESAADFPYRDPVLDEHTLVVGVTQSGETADTLQALHEARARGARTAAITNVPESEATRIVEHPLLMHAGHEVGVASTKTMINSMVVMYLTACALGRQRGALNEKRTAHRVDEVTRLPTLLGAAIEMTELGADAIAQRYLDARRFLFLGRGLMEPVAREGALKMKETSYIHAEGMSAAEMKHGPIALIDAETPVVAVAPRNPLYEKMLISMSEVRAREGKVIAIATVGSTEIASHADDVLWIPECPPLLQPMVAVAPLQLLAYRTADLLGNDVDQPRNLAKSVTVQ